MGEGALHEQAGDDEQEPAEEEAVACAYEDIDTARESAREEAGKGRAEGIEHNHAIAQEGELSTTTLTNIEDEDARDAYGTAEDLLRGEAVALEEQAGKQHHKEHAQRVEDGGTCSIAMRQTYIEETIVQGGVEQGEQQHVTPVGGFRHAEVALGGKGDEEQDEPRQGEAYAGKEHLAACHGLGDAKLGEAELDERVGPSPGDGCGEGE